MFIHTLAMAAAMLGGGEAASAVEAENPLRTRSVAYRIADLHDETRRAELAEDIRRAARAVCREHGRNGLHNAQRERACYDKALDQAQAQLERRAAAAGQRNLVRQVALRAGQR